MFKSQGMHVNTELIESSPELFQLRCFDYLPWLSPFGVCVWVSVFIQVKVKVLLLIVCMLDCSGTNISSILML